MTTPSPEHVEHVARAIRPDLWAEGSYWIVGIGDERDRALLQASAAILASQEWLEKNAKASDA